MTDQRLQKAREWANRGENLIGVIHPDAQAAIEIIQSLPDKWVDVEKVREIAEDLECLAQDSVLKSRFVKQAQRLRNLLAPKLPTLADMTAEERKACRWKQCRAKGFSEDERLVIAYVDDHWITLWREAGHSIRTNPGAVTPLPDLPKLQWPGSGGAPTIAQKERVADDQAVAKDVCNKPRRSAPLPGEAWLIDSFGIQRKGLYVGDGRWVSPEEGVVKSFFYPTQIARLHVLEEQ